MTLQPYNPTPLFPFILKTLRHHKLPTGLLVFNLIITTASLSIFFGLKLGLKIAGETTLKNQTNFNEIIVTPKTNPFGLSRLGQNVSTLTPEILSKIKTINHVKEVYPHLIYDAPSSVEINLLGQTFLTDSLIFGVPEAIVKSDLANKSSWNENTTPIPLIASRQILDLYNYTVAISQGLPTITESSLTDNPVIIHLNQSSFFPQTNQEKINLTGQIVGFSDKVNLLGLSLPLEIIQKLNQKLGKPERYQQLTIIIDDPKTVKSVADQIETFDLQTSYLEKSFNQLSHSFFYLNLLLLSLSLILSAITLSSLISTFLSLSLSRQAEFGLLKALGASRLTIFKIFSLEAGLISFIGSLLGVSLAFLSSGTINYFLLKSLKNISLIPEQIFIPSLEISAIIIFSSLAICLLAAFVPALKAANINPIQTLKI